MALFNNFLEGVATQIINTGLKKVAGNIPGLNISVNSFIVGSLSANCLNPNNLATKPMSFMNNAGIRPKAFPMNVATPTLIVSTILPVSLNTFNILSIPSLKT